MNRLFIALAVLVAATQAFAPSAFMPKRSAGGFVATDPDITHAPASLPSPAFKWSRLGSTEEKEAETDDGEEVRRVRVYLYRIGVHFQRRDLYGTMSM